MNDYVLQIGNILGCILQPLYTCLFILYTKNIRSESNIDCRNFFFILLAIIDYIIIQNSLSFKISISSDLIFAIILYLNLKLVYSKKARITDLVTYVISDIILGLINIVSYFIFGSTLVGLIFALVIPLIVVILLNDKLNIIDQFYNKYWNRKNTKVKIKSITVRGISLCMTVIVSLILHFWIVYIISR